MPRFITDPQYPNWPATAGRIKELFGLKPSTPWPAEGLFTRSIQGIDCWVNPLGTRFAIRARCRCPVCGDSMPIGRLAQHWRETKKPGHKQG